MKLRTRLNLVLTGVAAVFLAVLVADEIHDARSSVREEIEAANRVAAQVVGSLIETYAGTGGAGAVFVMLRQLGHVRANDITLRDADGHLLYHSPPAVYKAGRRAPDWFVRLLAPAPERQTITLGDGARVVIEAEASRAILDAWDDLTRLVLIAGGMLLALGAVAFWLVDRALAPFPVIVSALERLERGELTFRLPELEGSEARAIGAAFNRTADAVEDKVRAESDAREARSRLEERRELAALIEQSLEEERRLIAHELHDEFGQSVTAIRSLAMAIAARSTEVPTGEAARLISDEAARLYDAMHGLIPRLAPLSLDSVGLAAALESLVRDWQRRHPTPVLSLSQQLTDDLGASVTLAAYRVVQEGLVNALRHARAGHVMIEVSSAQGLMKVAVTDDGVGLPGGEWARPGHFGLRGLAERVEHLGGNLTVRNVEPHGVCLSAQIPLGAAA
jgi:two-component system, NarL family, sensor histidine kinase UhpB